MMLTKSEILPMMTKCSKSWLFTLSVATFAHDMCEKLWEWLES